MSKSLLVVIVFLCSIISCPEILWSREREVDLVWRSVERAVKYEIQISTSPDMDPVSFNETVAKTNVKVLLEHGIYYFRIRGIIDSGIPGPWGDPEAFVVNPRPPKLLTPVSQAVFNTLLPESGLTFSWSKGLPGSKYSIEISDEQGIVLRRGVNKTEFVWQPAGPGKYSWRVGFETPYKTEWGSPKTFTIEKTAFPPDAAADPITIVKEVIKTEIKTETVVKVKKVVQIKLIEDLGDPKDRPSEWWTFAWFQSNFLSYSENLPGQFASGSGSSGNYGFGLEQIYRGVRTPEKTWTHWISLRADFEQMSTFGSDSSYASLCLQYRLVHEGERVKWGPIGLLGYKKLPINVLITGASSTTSNDVAVVYPAAGIFFSYRPSKRIQTYFYLIEKFESVTGENKLGASVTSNVEAGIGANLFPSQSVTIEPKVRYWNEHFGWKANSKDATQDLQSIRLELGIGKKF